VPPFARRHGDPWCSTACFKADHGTLTPDEERSEILSRRIGLGKVQSEPYEMGRPT
jgi:hypothetical protein